MRPLLALPSPFWAMTFLISSKALWAALDVYKRQAHGFAPCRKVRAVDTTGAGYGFIGSFLWQLEQGV